MKLRWPNWILLTSSLLVAVLLALATNAVTHAAQAGPGSVTARVFVCPAALSLDAVLSSDDSSALLERCKPTTGTSIAPRLIEDPDEDPRQGDVFAEGVYLWPGLPFGSYEFAGTDIPAGFGGRLITDGADLAEADQERASVTINRAVPHIERRFYFFAPADPPEGAISLTLYRCPDADVLNPARCTLLVDPPDDHASLYPDLWVDGLRGVYRAGQTSWHGLPFGIYSVIFSGLVGPGEGAAIPELACVSPERCGLWIGPGAPSANLQLYLFPLPDDAPDSDGDGYSDPHERSGGTDPGDAASPGPDREHSRVDTDRDRLSDQDEALYGTDPTAPDTDGDSVPDGDEVARGTDPTALPRIGSTGTNQDGPPPGTATGATPVPEADDRGSEE